MFMNFMKITIQFSIFQVGQEVWNVHSQTITNFMLILSIAPNIMNATKAKKESLAVPQTFTGTIMRNTVILLRMWIVVS